MSSEGRSEGRDLDGGGRSASDTAAAEAALKAKLSRKRTKTGCLTCRKRRIKCGEERPVCKNCIKSKRHCEGYSQRVIFKPTFDYQPVPNGGAHITFQAGPILASAPPHGDPQGHIVDPSAFSQLRPRGPDQQQFVTVFDQRLQQYVTIPQPQPPSQPPPQHHPAPPYPQVGHQPAPNGHFSPEQGHFFQHGFHPATAQQPQQMLLGAPMMQHTPATTRVPASYPVASIPGTLEQYGEPIPPPGDQGLPPVTVPADHVRQAYGQPNLHGQQSPDHGYSVHVQPHHYPQEWADSKPEFGAEHEHIPAPPASSHSSSTLSFSQTPTFATQHQWTPSSYVSRPELSHPIEYQHPTDHPHATPIHHQEQDTLASLSDYKTPEFYEYEAQAPQHITPTTMLSAAAVETLDDDYWDVGSDEEEMDLTAQPGDQTSQDRQLALNRILALNRTNSHDLQMRRYDTFIYDGVLERYKVEEVASPLKNPATARVFAHFISVTGPSLSIFERHPRSSSVLFAEGSVPLSQQGLWTYTMPMAALRNQGLLHAMLAVASLQIARLQNASVTPSMQHYAWALRRIHATVGKHKKSRLKVTTIAASLLLGFYEIMTADHMKWNTHLAGSKQLFVETDFVKMTRDFRMMKADRARRFQPPSTGRFNSEEPLSQDALLDQIPDVDENLISHLAGQEVRYDNHGHVETSRTAISPSLDLSKFEILKDLYWWYCKQDVYQSIVSGNPLLLDYSRWANCPPRAPLGRTDAVYGTVDHLILLLGRVADFASRDRTRKLKQMEANERQGKSTPGMNPSRIPQPPPPTPVSATGHHQMPSSFPSMPMSSPGEQPNLPQFFGMAPPPRANVQMPSSYNPNYNIPTPQSAYSPIATDISLEASLHAALEEYGQIRSALHTFSTSLGESFEPLTSEYQTPMNTAFGTARFYRSYDIGTMWAIYNMAEIIAIRSHPHMHPSSHVAASVAAAQTAPFANEIGRIAAGIVPGPPNQPLNPTLGAAACESCMPSFFAAIQYTSPAQRLETVTRIFSIAKRTGWGSAELIANGVETAWVKAAEMGRGPPYQRIARPSEYVDDPRLNGSWEHLDPNAAPEGDNDGDRRLIGLKKEASLNWAIGVMGVEDDVQKIRISD